VKALLDGLLSQLKAYSSVHRKNIQPFTRDKISKHFPSYQDDFDHEIIRESLLEHVGSLPVIATYLHPHLDKPVDLGKVLTILAIHDIGELIVGDQLGYLKTSEQDSKEVEAAMTLLHDNYKDLYKEMDELQSNEAKFAKSIDKMAPDIFGYIYGEEGTIKRMVIQAGWEPDAAIKNMRAQKRPFMEWSPFLTEFHDELFNRYKSSLF
jgi:hypothetical protein